LLQGTNDEEDLAQEEMVLGGGVPAVSSLGIVGEEGMAGLGQMLTGVIPIDDLHTVGEQVRRQVPDPGGPIGGHATIGGLRQVGVHGGGPQGG
jgi:hypothetical protein